MPQLRSSTDVDVSAFLANGLGIKQHLSRYLNLTPELLEQRLPSSTDDLADLHPGAFRPEDATAFYEDTVGTGHLLELAAWHLSSADYIADTLRLQGMAVQGQVLDFGGGIGTHALSAAALPEVDHVWFVDLNPHNQAFVQQRAEALGLAHKKSTKDESRAMAGAVFPSTTEQLRRKTTRPRCLSRFDRFRFPSCIRWIHQYHPP